MQYTIVDTNTYTNHQTYGRVESSTLADAESKHTDIDVKVMSGDYFATLATLLDALPEHPQLDKTIKDLLYLQHNYKIVKK